MSDQKYLFERGPWPQPAPQAPDAAPPAVLHLPCKERSDWSLHVGFRYIRQSLTELPEAMLWAAMHAGLEEVDDGEFAVILTDGIIGKFLCPTLNEYDETVFAKYLRDPEAKAPDERWFKSDFTPMEFIKSEPQGDSATAATVILWRRTPGDRGRYSVVAIAVDDVVFDPRSPRESWELAKYFALQGAGVCTTLLMHPLLHFPSDAINAITKTLLPVGHPLQKLLLPHFYLQLGVDDAVLHNGGTVLKQAPFRFYAPYPGAFSEHTKIVDSLWTGSNTRSGQPNSAFPRYVFPLDGWKYHCPYSEFLREYFETLLRFTTEFARVVLGGPKEQLAVVRQWARHIALWIPGFPGEDAIAEGDNLARALASVIHDVAVGHSADHYLYSRVNQRKVPFILHSSLPTGDGDALDRRTLVTWWDNVRYRMCMKMFFNPSPVTRLMDVDYGFDDSALQQAARSFRTDLLDAPNRIAKKGLLEYIPLREMAAGVQF